MDSILCGMNLVNLKFLIHISHSYDLLCKMKICLVIVILLDKPLILYVLYKIFNYYFEITIQIFLLFLICNKVRCLRSGYRSVPLQNNYSEDLELASLLIHLRIISSVSIKFYFYYFIQFCYFFERVFFLL